jgi:hypothetical protein
MSTLNTPKRSTFLSFLFLVCLISISAATATAATYTVMNTNDSGDGSLRQAIIDANASAEADTIVFDMTVFATPQTITLTDGQITISGSLTLNGPGAKRLNVRRGDDAPSFRIFEVSALASVNMSGLTISGGSADLGGGIKNLGKLSLQDAAVSENRASTGGGGIHTGGGGELRLKSSTISDNYANTWGGGMLVWGAPALIDNSTISGNVSGFSGGAIDYDSDFIPDDRDYYDWEFTGWCKCLIIRNSTITKNHVGAWGGGVFKRGGIIVMFSSILAENTTSWQEPNIAGGIYLGDNNIVNSDPMLSPLAYNGGPTMTHALLPGSPAIDAGSNPNSLTTDQRGYMRSYDFAAITNGDGGPTDIGAFELDPDTDGDGVRDFTDNCRSTPNPEKIAFTSTREGNQEIYVMNADGSNQTRLTNNAALDNDPSFSPDGTRIAFTSNRDGGADIYVMNADGSNQTNLTNNGVVDAQPTFSPDGSKIAFTSTRDGNTEIYVMNADGSNQTRLTNNAASDVEPSFSPDGSRITFRSSRDGNQEIYVMNADGTNQTNLTNNASLDVQPTFSPDGSRIAFISDRDGNIEIYVMNADGTNQTNLTNNPPVNFEPTFSPDGSKIAFTSFRDGAAEIYVMNADGTGQTRLTNNGVIDFQPSWGGQADADGDGVGDACETAPTVTVMDAPAATQYSDVVTLSSTTTSNGSPVTAGTVEFFVNGVSVGTDAVDANGVATLNTQILLAAGNYAVSAEYAANGDYLASTDADSLTVTKEDATVTASASNAASVLVSSPGGTGGPIVFCADIADEADGSLGDIALAVPVTFTFAPVAPGSQIVMQDAELTSGQACVTLASVPVNVYDVTITVGGNYYTGSCSSVLAVFDPTLGFTTGGGRVLNPSTGNILQFGFSFKYDKKGFKGQMLVMEHLADGSVTRLKSNSLSSLSIVGNRALVLGKANMLYADGTSLGNLSFRLDATDNGEPGTSDLFGLKTTTPGGASIAAFSIDPPSTILGGNVQVPQGAKK